MTTDETFVALCDENGMRCREEDATHQLVTVPGPRGGQTVMRERHPSCQPRKES